MGAITRLVVRAIPGPVLRWASRLQYKSRFFKAMHRRVTGTLRNQNGVIQRGLGQGLRINIGNSNAGYLAGTADQEQLALYATLLKPGMVFYDGGANIGYLSLVLARLLGKEGRVVAFEPLPENATILRNNVALNKMENLTVCEVALGDVDGYAEFRVGGEVVHGKLAGSAMDVGPEASQAIRVAARRLDTVVAEQHLPPPDLIKLDIEGSEAVTLAASREFLREHKPLLLVEIHRTNREMEQVLRELNYHYCVCEAYRADIHANWYLHVLAWPAGVPFLDRFLPRIGRTMDWV
jgi:FkbM family methyltransferase